jgi:hypothetical protein
MLRHGRTVTLALLLLFPAAARPDAVPGGGQARELTAEALFLCDPVPPGGAELGLAVTVAAPPDQGTAPEATPRLQAALPLSDRVGLTVDVGLTSAPDAPSGSLKVLLVRPAAGTALAASVDLFGATHGGDGPELGVGLALLHGAGPVTLRAALSGASPARAFGPHLHGGLSAAAPLGDRVRVLAELVGEVGGGERALAAAPGVKVAFDERTALALGVLLPLAGDAGPVAATLVVTRSQ